MEPPWDLIIGAVMGTTGSGVLGVAWGIVKDSRARKLVNEESAIGHLRYLKEEAEKEAREAREDADKRIAAADATAARAWKIVAWYRNAYAVLWQAYKIGPPPGEKDFPFGPPEDLH